MDRSLPRSSIRVHDCSEQSAEKMPRFRPKEDSRPPRITRERGLRLLGQQFWCTDFADTMGMVRGTDRSIVPCMRDCHEHHNGVASPGTFRFVTQTFRLMPIGIQSLDSGIVHQAFRSRRFINSSRTLPSEEPKCCVSKAM
jgi:hypothetical protein